MKTEYKVKSIWEYQELISFYDNHLDEGRVVMVDFGTPDYYAVVSVVSE